MTSLVMATIAILASIHGVAAQPPATRSYEIRGHGSLEIDVPAAWKDSVTQPRGGRPPNISLVAGGADDLLVTITPVWDPRRDRSFTTPETLRRIVEQSGQHLLPGSEEKALVLEPISGPSARGFRFTLTDQSVTGRGAAGSYPYITQGAVATGELVVVFSIFHRTKAGPEREAALAMMATARQQSGPAASAPARSGRTALSLPGYQWAVALDLSGFTVTGDEISTERGTRMVSAESADRTVYLSLFLEKVPAATSARGCRTRYQERLARSPIMRDVRVQSSETDALAFAEYTIERYEGSTINQKHVNTYLAHEDVCVDLHLSKVRFTSGDHRLFVPVVQSLGIEPR